MAGIRYKGQIFSGAASFGSADEVSVNDGSGQVTDTQTIISRILGDFAEIESSATASKAYAVGDYLVLNGYFYKVTASIAIDDELVEGTNIEKTTVASEASDLVNPAWGNITGKPSTFTPSSHSHAWSEITSKPSNIGDSGQKTAGTKYGGTVYYRKLNGFVAVYMANTSLSGMTANADNTFATLPSGYRPGIYAAIVRTYGDHGYVFVGTNGNITIHPDIASGSFAFYITYIPA